MEADPKDSEGSKIDNAALKLELEVEKLRAETARLNRSFLKEPTSWLALLPLVFSLGGNLIQYSKAETDRKLAEIHKQELLRDNRELEARNTSLDTQRQQLQSAVIALDKQMAEANERKREMDTTLAKMASDIASKNSTLASLAPQVQQVRELNIQPWRLDSAILSRFLDKPECTSLQVLTGRSDPCRVPVKLPSLFRTCNPIEVALKQTKDCIVPSVKSK